MNLKYIATISILTYLLAALAQSCHLLGTLPWKKRHYLILSVICLASHGWVLYQLVETPQGQNLSWLIMLSCTLWLMNILTWLTAWQSRVENICVLTYPLTACSLGLALYLGGTEVVDTKAQLGVLAHIFISLFAMSFLSLASLQAVLLGWQNHLLKHHRPSPMLQILPPLQTMENMLFHIVWAGLCFLSATLLSGFYFQAGLFAPFLLPKTILALVAWVLLLCLLLGRYRFGWRGPTAIRWTLYGTLLSLLSYFGTKAFYANLV